jgi:glyoxylase-like metal-dependent hydrolase (beta-lactamase superfamily II)
MDSVSPASCGAALFIVHRFLAVKPGDAQTERTIHDTKLQRGAINQMEIIPVDDHITAIDHYLLGMPGAGVTYVVRGEDIALIETGTSLTVEKTLAGLDELGISREAVSHILCTHVHMDHAGGAGYLAEALPRANVYIHSLTSQHLVEPSKLLSSVRRAVGEVTWPLHGDIRPLPPERLHPAEALRLDLGQDVVLEALPTPGHSPDHVAFWEYKSGGMFIGDAASLMHTRYDLNFPVTPPPAYDMEQQLATVRMLRQHDINVFYVTHAGPFEDVAYMLQLTEEMLHSLSTIVQDAIDRGDEEDTFALAARWLPPTGDENRVFLARNLGDLTVRGMMRYLKKRQA